jgi:hypothetical protein
MVLGGWATLATRHSAFTSSQSSSLSILISLMNLTASPPRSFSHNRASTIDAQAVPFAGSLNLSARERRPATPRFKPHPDPRIRQQPPTTATATA